VILVFEKIREKIRNWLRPKELYVRVADTRTYQAVVPKAVSWENAQLKKENLLLKKALKEKEAYIQSLIQKLEGKAVEEAYEQEKLLKDLKTSREFKILFKPEKPIILVSAYSFEPFRDAAGVAWPYLAGIKLCHDVENVLPYVVFLLKKTPDGIGRMMVMRTSPKIYFPFDFIKLFRDIRSLFTALKYGGKLEILVTPDFLFTGNKLYAEKEEEKGGQKKPGKAG